MNPIASDEKSSYCDGHRADLAAALATYAPTRDEVAELPRSRKRQRLAAQLDEAPGEPAKKRACVVTCVVISSCLALALALALLVGLAVCCICGSLVFQNGQVLECLLPDSVPAAVGG